MPPSYLTLFESGALQKIADDFISRLHHCDICPRRCGVDRTGGQPGYCQTGRFARVSSFFRHFGEEPPLAGVRGSGTIFFSWCNLRCVFCQNDALSHLGEGSELSAGPMADIMLSLQQEGAHNINFVSPTHVVPQILEALCMACGRGLNIPLVYNTGGYDAAETIKELSGIFDIYLPDMKYSDSGNAEKYSDAPDYPDQCFSSVREMHRQAGILETDSLGVAQRGLMVRHLVLPSGLAGSRRTLDFIAGELSASTYVNIMDQYHPCCRASDFPELRRRISPEEYENVVAYARKIGLARLEA